MCENSTRSGAPGPGQIPLCLEFANTFRDGHTQQRNERRAAYKLLVAWSVEAGAIGKDMAVELLAEAERRPDEAADVYQQALALRQTIYAIFSAVASGRQPEAALLEQLNGMLATAFGRLRIAAGPAGFQWTWADDPGALDRLLWPVLNSAAELATSPLIRRVGECASETCRWLFVDHSRNHSRRWCDMGECGNRAKARRHYQRRQRARQ